VQHCELSNTVMRVAYALGSVGVAAILWYSSVVVLYRHAVSQVYIHGDPVIRTQTTNVIALMSYVVANV
jgi:hypothetical protein